jgi:branched-chain amino acid transport system substrate-binding protein
MQFLNKRMLSGGLALIALAAAGCSSSSKSASSSPTTQAAGSSGATGSTGSGSTGSGSTGSGSTGSSAGLTKAPIVVGVIADESSGPTGQASQDVPRTLAAWQNYVNSHGGINGHPVKYINKDEALDPAKAATAIQTFIGDHVVAILDNSSINATWAATAANAHIPVLSLNESASGDTYEANPDFFGNGTTVLGILWGHTAMAAKAGGKVFGGAYCTEVPQCKTAVAIWKADAPKNGMKFGLGIGAPTNAPNYTAQCVALKEAGVDAVFPIVSPPQFADDCSRQGYHPIYIGSQGTLQNKYAQNPNLNGAYQNQTGFPWMLDNTPALQEFHAAMDSVLASADNPAGIAASWTGLMMLDKALANVSATPTAQDVYNGLYAMHGETLGGLAATPLTFTQGKPTTQRCYFVTQIKNGNWTAPYGMTPQCEPSQFISATG